MSRRLRGLFGPVREGLDEGRERKRETKKIGKRGKIVRQEDMGLSRLKN
jgi:hypothetical protein